MSLTDLHINEILEIANKKFRVPKIMNKEELKKRRAQSSKKKNDKISELLQAKNDAEKAKEDEYSDHDDSSSSDDELFAYWLKEDKKEENDEESEEEEPDTPQDTQAQALKDNQGQPNQEMEPKTTQAESTQNQPKSKKNFTHFLHFPLYDFNKFSKRCQNFQKDVLRQFPQFDKFFKIGKPHLTILPLALTDFQVDILSQVLAGFTQAHPECRIKASQARKRRIRIDVKGIKYFSISGNDARKTRTIWAQMVQNAEFSKLETIIHSIVSKVIELGIVKDSEIENARFDLSELKYKLEKPHVTLMKGKGDTFDATLLLKQFLNFNFGFVDITKVCLSKMGGDYEVVAEANLTT